MARIFQAPDPGPAPVEPRETFLRRVALCELEHWQRRCESLERALAYKALREAPAPVPVSGDAAGLARRRDALTEALRKYADRENWSESAQGMPDRRNRWIGPGGSGHEVAEKALECEPGGGAAEGAKEDAGFAAAAERKVLRDALVDIVAGPPDWRGDWRTHAERSLRIARKALAEVRDAKEDSSRA